MTRSRRYAREIERIPIDVVAYSGVYTPQWQDDPPLTDDELTALALGEDPNIAISGDAVPFAPLGGSSALPAWYMPSAVIRSSARWHRPLIFAVIAAFVIIDAFGLCSTYG